MNNLPWLFTIGELIFFILKLNKKEQIVQKKNLAEDRCLFQYATQSTFVFEHKT